MKTLEIILPLRNPPAVIESTISSLLAQTDRSFSVLISDNHSQTGVEVITAAVEKFTAAGIPVRAVKPPRPLGRVEHWNWAHYEASAEWLKPVFAGDSLSPDYIANLRAAMTAHPECLYVYSGYVLHRQGEPNQTIINAWTGRFYSAAEMSAIVLKYGMQFGPPSAAAFERDAFIALGGYPTQLPICADCLLFCTLAARYGAFGLPKALCHFNIHGARFSTGLPQKRKNTLSESITYYLMLAYYLWTENVPVSRWTLAKLLLREYRAYWRGGA